VKSYDAAREHADLDSEIERLGAQLALSWPKELRALKAFGLDDAMTIVDLGCGPGHSLAKLRIEFAESRLIGVELDSDLCAAAMVRLKGHPRVTLINRSALDTGLAASSADFVIARLLFQHLADPIGAAKEALRILRPGGALVVIDVDQSIWGLADPRVPELESVMRRYAALNAAAGRDRSIGRKLWRILTVAGFGDVQSNAALVHSDEVGLKSFASQLDLGRLTHLGEEGVVSAAELESARDARDRFLASPDSIMMTLNLLVCGRKPRA